MVEQRAGHPERAVPLSERLRDLLSALGYTLAGSFALAGAVMAAPIVLLAVPLFNLGTLMSLQGRAFFADCLSLYRRYGHTVDLLIQLTATAVPKALFGESVQPIVSELLGSMEPGQFALPPVAAPPANPVVTPRPAPEPPAPAAQAPGVRRAATREQVLPGEQPEPASPPPHRRRNPR